MKKLLLTTGITFLLIFNAQAQEDTDFIKNKTTFGVKGGFNYSFLYSSENLNLSDSDVYIGLFSDTRLSEKLSFQSELLYSTSSGHRFVEVPLLIKYHINDKWQVFAGPSLSFSMNNDRNINNRRIEPLGISSVIGVQYNFSKRFFIEGFSNLALTNQINSPYNNPNTSFFRNTFRIGIGYKF